MPLSILKILVCINLVYMLLTRCITVDTRLAVSWYQKEKNHSHLNADKFPDGLEEKRLEGGKI